MSRLLFKTKEDKARDAARRRERAIDKECEKECRYFERLIPNVLANSGIDHWLPRPDRPTVIESTLTGAVSRQKVRIIETRYNHYAIYLWVETRKLPYRTVPAHLHTDEILEALSEACERQVVWRSRPGNGSWFVVWRDGAINAIPEKFYYNDAIVMIPDNAGPLYFIVGVTENNALIKGNLVDMPHYLVAGSTNTGKSVHLNQMLCQLISRNTPETLQMLMIDLKGGSEFTFYENLPHLWRPIITRPENVVEALEAYYAEMERRSELFTSHGVKTIEGYNDKFKDAQLPYILLVFDELALLITDRDRKMVGRAEDLLSAILARSRSSGGHSVLCTQNARTDIVKPFIKINCSTRICFSVPGMHDSIAILDRGDAAGLEPAGRAIYSSGPRLTELQSPYITDKQIADIVKEAIERGGGVAPRQADTVTLNDLLDQSINNFSGKLHTNLLYKQFGGLITRERIDAMIAGLMDQTVTFQGRRYQAVYKGKGRHGGRMLIPLDDQGTDSAAFSGQPALRLVLPRFVPKSALDLLKPKSKPAVSEDRSRGTADEVA
jgi:DNA segregation ATPase FtsK/SpoIIIE-like protein